SQHTDAHGLASQPKLLDQAAPQPPTSLDASAEVTPPQRRPSDLITLGDALTGRPDLGLTSTASSTLYYWMKTEATARILGVDWKAKPGAQLLLVSGLLQLKAAQSPGRKPPHKRKKAP